MEVGQPTKELRGFSDNVTIDMVESGARFGVVALLYYELTDDGSSKAGAAGQTGSGTAAGSASSSTAVASATAATGATSAGVITAGTVGWSTAAIVGLGVGAAAVAGGTAVAIDNANDDDDHGDDHHDNTGGTGEELTEKSIVGYWNLDGTSTEGSTTEGSFTFNEGNSFSYSFITTNTDNSNREASGEGTWTLSGTDLVLNFDAGAIYEGVASGDSDAFTMVATNNSWTLNFKR
jgi:hypothetical protein